MQQSIAVRHDYEFDGIKQALVELAVQSVEESGLDTLITAPNECAFLYCQHRYMLEDEIPVEVFVVGERAEVEVCLLSKRR